MYTCPVCQHPLTLTNRTWSCVQNHSFDQHKKGYVNLLLAQNKRSKAPGDDAEMVNSRRRFLDAGHYQPLAAHLARQFHELLPPNATVWDAGCGEGYYTALIHCENPDFTFFGLDISKPAIAAASRYKSIEWCVASSAHPPYGNESFDGILSVFSRIDVEPFYRVLKPGGRVCMVVPDHDHLLALRTHIYDEVRDYDVKKHTDYFDERFELVTEQRLNVSLTLNSNEQVFDLLGMTPHAHRLSTEARERLTHLTQLKDAACFKVYWFEKKT